MLKVYITHYTIHITQEDRFPDDVVEQRGIGALRSLCSLRVGHPPLLRCVGAPARRADVHE